jgi:hypothetical protein
MGGLVEQHSGELTILIMGALLLGTLLVLVPQLLRHHHQGLQMKHEEHMRALEQGQPLPIDDVRIRFAGRTASLVPMLAVCAAGAVTCFVAGYKPEALFSVTLAVWTVSGVVCLAAITGGVALMSRLENEMSENPTEQGVADLDRRRQDREAG